MCRCYSVKLTLILIPSVIEVIPKSRPVFCMKVFGRLLIWGISLLFYITCSLHSVPHLLPDFFILSTIFPCRPLLIGVRCLWYSGLFRILLFRCRLDVTLLLLFLVVLRLRYLFLFFLVFLCSQIVSLCILVYSAIHCQKF